VKLVGQLQLPLLVLQLAPGTAPALQLVVALQNLQFGYPKKLLAHWLQLAPANPVLHVQRPIDETTPWPLQVTALLNWHVEPVLPGGQAHSPLPLRPSLQVPPLQLGHARQSGP